MQEKHPKVKVIEKHVSRHTDIECQCLTCRKEWLAKPYSLLQGHAVLNVQNLVEFYGTAYIYCML